jgi:hypothetical protein
MMMMMMMMMIYFMDIIDRPNFYLRRRFGDLTVSVLKQEHKILGFLPEDRGSSQSPKLLLK